MPLEFFPFHVTSRQAELATMSLSERGAYLTLACHCWTSGGVPDEPARLARLCGASKREFTKAWAGLRRRFDARSDGLLVLPWIEELREDQLAFRAGRVAAGKRGAERRWRPPRSDGSAIAEPLAEPRPCHGEASGRAIAEPMANDGSIAVVVVGSSSFLSKTRAREEALAVAQVLAEAVREREPQATPNARSWVRELHAAIEAGTSPANLAWAARYAHSDLGRQFWGPRIVGPAQLVRSVTALVQQRDVAPAGRARGGEPLICINAECQSVAGPQQRAAHTVAPAGGRPWAHRAELHCAYCDRTWTRWTTREGWNSGPDIPPHLRALKRDQFQRLGQVGTLDIVPEEQPVGAAVVGTSTGAEGGSA